MKKIYKTVLGVFLLLGIIGYAANLQAQTYYSLNTSSLPSSAGYASPGGGYYPAGQNVSVTAYAVNGYVFTGWTGSVNSNMNPVTVTMNSNKTLIANFTPITLYNLTVNTSPSNGGYVSGAGTGQFPAGQQITVNAIPSSGYHFVNWTGSVNSTSNPMTFTMSSNMTVTANFEPNIIAISSGATHSLFLKFDGSLWACGQNSHGEFGNGTNSSNCYIVQTGLGATWKCVSAGQSSFSVGIKSNGTLWAWGDNSLGQLGNGTTSTTPCYSPVQIGSDANWAKVSAGSSDYLVIKTDGSLWEFGLLRDGVLGSRQVGTDQDWVDVSNGTYRSYAGIKSDGSLWTWGFQLGSTNNLWDPTMIVTDKNWKQVCVSGSHALAIKTNGTLWSWGYNNYGQLGDGTNNPSATPIQIQTDVDWKYVSSHSDFNSFALKNNGTVWGWGLNAAGPIGDGTNNQRLSPTQAIGISNKSLISSGMDFSLAYGNDNTLCGSGDNSWGQLGIGCNGIVQTYTFYCSPLSSIQKSTPYQPINQESKIFDPSKSILSQNFPNPTQGTTTIEYYLSDDAVSAKMVLYSFTGNIVKEYALNGKGKSSIGVDLTDLPAGIYSYALFVNGSKADVKKLLLVK